MSTKHPDDFDYQMRAPAAIWLLFFAGFVIYGSLYPFDFLDSPQPVESLLSEISLFRDRADVIDNFALFVPLGVGIVFAVPSLGGRLALGLLLWGVLGLGVQFVQLYLPTRVASLGDALWNAVGLAAGLGLARFIRPLLARNRQVSENVLDRFAVVTAALWICYESFPFLPTLDVSLLRAHVKSFVFAPEFEWMRLAQHGLAGFLGAISVLRSGIRVPRWMLLGAVACAVLAIEVFAAYGSLRRESVAGILLGMLAAERIEYFTQERSRYWVFVVALGFFLITVLTPFKDQLLDGEFTFTPFSRLLWHGITKEIPPTAAEMLAIASLLWAGTSSRGVFSRRPGAWIGFVFFMVLVLEAVRVGVMGYHGDTTPAAMTVLLGALLYGLRKPLAEPLPLPRRARVVQRASVGATGTKAPE